MPVLINNDTQLAESLPQEHADLALQRGTHALPLYTPEGEPVAASLQEAHSLIQQGHTQPSPEQLDQLLAYAKHSTPLEQAGTFLQGAGKTLTFGLSTGIQRAMGDTPEDIRARAEVNPGWETAGELSGLAVSALMGTGEAKALESAGEAASRAIVPSAEGVIGRAAQSSIKAATEMAMLQSGDEVSKMLASDPDQTAQTALVHVGLSGLLGGFMGGGARAGKELLWDAVQGPKLQSVLRLIQEKAQGVENATQASELAKQAGLDLAPEIKSALSGNEVAKSLAQELKESSTKAGARYREGLDKFYESASNNLIEKLGSTPEKIEALGELSDFESGKKLQSALSQELKDKISPVSEQFSVIRDKYKGMALPDNTHQEIAESLGRLVLDEGYGLSKSSPALKEINSIIADLPNLKTLEDLRLYQAVARENLRPLQNFRLAKQVSSILRGAEEDSVEMLLGRTEPQLVPLHREARAQYSALMDTMEELNDRLHLGKFYGPDSFLKNLSEATPEMLLQRLRGSSDASLLSMLKSEFPITAKEMADYHLNSALKKAAEKAEKGLNTNKLLSIVGSWSPELREFALPEKALESINATRELLTQLPQRLNPSGTARTLDGIWKHIPGGAGAMISMMMGHNPIIGGVLGHVGRLLGREAPDMGKLAFLKFLGSDAPVNSRGFKAMFEFVNSAFRGEKMLDGAARAIFKSGAEVLPTKLIPSESQTSSLNRYIRAAQANPEVLLRQAHPAGHYMPETSASLASTAANAVNVLTQYIPAKDKLGVLDAHREPSEVEKARYDRALQMAEQPLLSLHSIKAGTLLPEDLHVLSSLYPSLYERMKSKLMEQVVDRGDRLTFPQRQSLSLFLGYPLEASLKPENIVQNSQVATSIAPAPSPMKGNTGKAPKNAFSLSATPGQAREKRLTA